MKIVIDIPEKLYNRIRSDNGHCYCSLRDDDMHEVVLALCDGVVIPKGHGDLIDRDTITVEENVYFQNYIIHAPTIIKADKGE